MDHIKVIKKDFSVEDFDGEKIKAAVGKAATRCDVQLTQLDYQKIVDYVLYKVVSEKVDVKDLHEIVISALNALHFNDVANSYSEYRYYKTQYAKTFEKLRQDADDVLRLGDKENANFDSSLVSTKGSLIKGYLTKSLYKQFYLSKREKELIERGDIYIHDIRDMILASFNCNLFDIGNVLKGGFEMSNVRYSEPKSVLSALQVIGDITLVATAQQFGGFTLAEIDKVLLPYVIKTYNNAKREFQQFCKDEVQCERYANSIVDKELRQGFQSLELKLNTVPCSRGDFAFTTLTFGQWDWKEKSEFEKNLLSKICIAALKTRIKGHNGRRVVFPKLVYLFDDLQVESDEASKRVYDMAIKCSSTCMYPDWLSLRGNPEHNVVAKLFIEHGVITSPMG